jgi:hypothetical protein
MEVPGGGLGERGLESHGGGRQGSGAGEHGFTDDLGDRQGRAWRRCNTTGDNCDSLGSGSTQRLSSADVGHRIRVSVTAANQYGSSGAATSVPTAVVTSALPSGAVKLPNGQVSLPIEAVLPPERLVISSAAFVPTRLHTRSAFIGRFRVTDTRGSGRGREATTCWRASPRGGSCRWESAKPPRYPVCARG